MNAKSIPWVGAALCAALMFSTNLAAHTTVVKKRVPDGEGGYSYKAEEPDGASSILNTFSIPHGCKPGYLPVIAQTVLFPNGEDVFVVDAKDSEVNLGSGVLYDVLDGVLENATPLVIGPKPAQEANWKFQDVRTGPVPPHYNHGPKTTDVRAFVYEGGNIPNGYLGLMRWRATFAKIKDDSCVQKIVLRIPIVNYCTREPSEANRMDAWIGRATPVFDASEASIGWWPEMTIDNTGYNEDACGPKEDGIVYWVSPSDDDIDTFLPIDSFKP